MFGLSESSGSFFVKKGQSEAMLMAIETLKKLKMRITRVDAINGVILAEVSAGFRSMGENVSIQMKKTNEGILMEVYSECNNRKQKIDWGKNKDNINRIVSTLAEFQNKEYPNAEASLMTVMNQINSTGSGISGYGGCIVFLIVFLVVYIIFRSII